MWFSHAKGHVSILYVGCIEFLTNRFIENLCPKNNRLNQFAI
jgi:hypothetical protein